MSRPRKSNGGLGKDTALTKRNIMAAIVKTKGPVSNHKVLVCSWKFLRLLTAKQYYSACQELETLNIGTLGDVQYGSRASQLFFKKPPEVARHGLESNPDLCSVEYYAERYKMSVSNILSKKVRDELATMGFLMDISKP